MNTPRIAIITVTPTTPVRPRREQRVISPIPFPNLNLIPNLNPHIYQTPNGFRTHPTNSLYRKKRHSNYEVRYIPFPDLNLIPNPIQNPNPNPNPHIYQTPNGFRTHPTNSLYRKKRHSNYEVRYIPFPDLNLIPNPIQNPNPNPHIYQTPNGFRTHPTNSLYRKKRHSNYEVRYIPFPDLN
jgi:hypothetical protein